MPEKLILNLFIYYQDISTLNLTGRKDEGIQTGRIAGGIYLD